MPHLPQAADRLHPPKDLLRYHLERRIARNRSDDAFVQAFPAETTEAFCAGHTRFRQGNLWVANYYSARNPLRLSSLVILGVVARMFRCATRSSCWCT